MIRTYKSIQALFSQVRIPLLLASIVIFMGVMAVDYLTLGSLIATDPQPALTGSHLLRTGFIALSALLFVVSARPNFPGVALETDRSNFVLLELGKERKISISASATLWFCLLLSLAIVTLFILSAEAFAILSNEDHVVESASALFAFFSCANILIVFLALRRQSANFRSFYFVALALLAVLFFLIGMEEVSWFQRVFGFATPAAFDANEQAELNLHNFASNLSEIVYYFGSFVYLILFSFLFNQMALLSQSKFISFFAPGPTSLFAGAGFAAFNFNLWNNTTIQFAFFATLFILITYARAAWTRTAQPPSPMRYYLLALCVVLLATQIVFIAQGHTLLKGWEVTEYKELLIPIAFLIYSLEMLMKVKKTIGPRVLIPAALISLVFLALRLLEKLRA